MKLGRIKPTAALLRKYARPLSLLEQKDEQALLDASRSPAGGINVPTDQPVSEHGKES